MISVLMESNCWIVSQLTLLDSKMAEVVYNLLECDLEIRPKIECVTLDSNFNLTYSEVREIWKTPSESSALELKLDIDELQ